VLVHKSLKKIQPTKRSNVLQ